MAYFPDDPQHPLDDALRARIESYYPVAREEAAIDLNAAEAHLRAARGTIALYLPRQIVGAALDRRLTAPWLRWIDGSLLFADLSGSTALAERLGALGREGTEIVTAFLNSIFATMTAIVERRGGDLMAFGGDALLVLFSDDSHELTAATAAAELQLAMRGYVREVAGVGSFPMQLHIGLESGRVALAAAGARDALHYTVLGETVNRVALAESYAGPEETVVGPAMWRAIGAAARGAAVRDGFVRLDGLEGAADAVPSAIALPDRDTIVQLLDDLDRICAYLPHQLLRRILAAPEQPQVEAELRPVTVLFAQVRGLERAVQQSDPDRAAQIVEAYVLPMQAAVRRFGGVVNKLDVADEGLKLLAVFGAPVAYEDHTERAARAALAMQRELELIGPVPGDGGGLRQRIGLNLGVAFAGNVGGATRQEYTVMGDAVNTAARVMSAAAWDEVWCAESVAASLSGQLICEPRGAVQLKGKAQPLGLARLRGEQDDPRQVLALYRSMGALMGRAAELERLRTHLTAALGGRGGAVRLVGEAGVGKSRLAAALVEQAARAGARIMPALCLSHAAGVPYSAWGEWLKSRCGIGSGDGATARAEKLAAALESAGDGLAEWTPLLGDLLRLDLDDNWLTRGLDPQQRQERRFALIEQLLLSADRAGPVVVVFENLHWADPISLNLWRRVSAKLSERAVLLLGVHRSAALFDDEPDAASEVLVGELPADASEALVDELAADQPIAATMRSQLVARASGNPLFLSELVRAVLETAARHDVGGSVVETLPESLNGLLLARIDRLEESARSLVLVASVIGQRIPIEVLESIAVGDRQQVVRQLGRLDDAAVTVLERSDPDRVHSFRHALLQEVAYQSLLYSRRRAIHRQIGECLERRYGADAEDYVGLLAHHFRLSDEPERGVPYLLLAGHAARDVFANDEAAQYYLWAIESAASGEREALWRARDGLADVYGTTGRYDDALDLLAHNLAAPGIDAALACEALRKRGSLLEKRGEYGAALDELRRAMALAQSDDRTISPLAVPLVAADICLVHKRRGEYDLAIAACEHGLTELRSDPRTRDDELIEARLHSELGTIYGVRGDYRRAQHHLERSLRAREQIDDLPGMVSSHNNLGYLLQLQADYAAAIEHYRVVEDLARRIGLRYALIHAAGNAAYTLTCLGEYDEAERRCLAALELAGELNASQTSAQLQITLGIIHYRRGEYDLARAAFESSHALNLALNSAHEAANARMYLSQVLCAQRRYAEAAELAREVVRQAEEMQAQILRLEALSALADALLGMGDARAAAELARTAAALGEQTGSEEDTGIAYRLMGRAAAALGEPYDAAFARSEQIFIATRERFELARTYDAYAQTLDRAGNQVAATAYTVKAQQIWRSLSGASESAT